jgi:DNA polymerase III sliding clamp (beta) subunit (PCNA family)
MSKSKVTAQFKTAELHAAIKKCLPAVPSKAIERYHELALIEVSSENGICKITAGTVDYQIESHVSCESKDDVKFCIDPDLVLNTLTGFQEEDCKIDFVVDNGKYFIAIKTTNNKNGYKISSLPSDHYPVAKVSSDVVATIKFSLEEMKKAFAFVSGIPNKNDLVLSMRGIRLMKSTDDKFSLTAVSNAFLCKAEVHSTITVPTFTCVCLPDIINPGTGTGMAELIITNKHITFIHSGITVKGRLIDEKFPNAEQLMSRNPGGEIVMDRVITLQAMKRLKAFTSRESMIEFNMKNEGEMVVSAFNKEVENHGIETLPATTTYELPISFGANVDYMIDALSNLPCDQFVISTKNDVKMPLFVSQFDKGDASFESLICKMRTV